MTSIKAAHEKIANQSRGRISRRSFTIGTGAAALTLTTAGAAGAQGTPVATPEGTPDATPVGGVQASPVATPGRPLKVAFVYIGPTADLGWTYAHDQGRLALAAAHPEVETVYVENIPEAQAESEPAIRGFAEQGQEVIIATSFGYGPAMLAVAPQFPETQFIHISGYQTAENVSTGFGKIEEPRYVAGFVAGRMSSTGKLGYVAAFPIPEVLRGINAFTLGVRAANPEATVQVVWTNTWYNPATERTAAEALLDGGADVIAQHQDTPAPQQAAEAAGKFSIGYNVDMSSQAPAAVLTGPVWNWGAYYISAIEQIQAGTWSTNQYWGSWQEGVVDLAPIAEFVPAEVRTEAEALADEFRAGTRGNATIFRGPLLDQDGAERVAEGVSMTDEEILTMDWFVEGVQGSSEG
ncbi:MAG: BMP family ABC transporter substrate-binding protein [Chloroflexia bacterium]|nr:BMP family ABC transporter substrate-binding protein [Chloroflexia bacterium]